MFESVNKVLNENKMKILNFKQLFIVESHIPKVSIKIHPKNIKISPINNMVVAVLTCTHDV